MKEVERNVDNKRRNRDQQSTITNISELQRLGIFVGGDKEDIIYSNVHMVAQLGLGQKFVP